MVRTQLQFPATKNKIHLSGESGSATFNTDNVPPPLPSLHQIIKLIRRGRGLWRSAIICLIKNVNKSLSKIFEFKIPLGQKYDIFTNCFCYLPVIILFSRTILFHFSRILTKLLIIVILWDWELSIEVWWCIHGYILSPLLLLPVW